MTDKEKDEIALFRYGLIAQLVTCGDQYKSNHEYFRQKASEGPFSLGDKTIRVSPSTIERWFYSYRKHGFEALRPKNRNDCGRTRKIDDDVLIAIKQFIENHPRMPATLIYEELINNHYFTRNDVSQSTITRYVKRLKNKTDIINHSEMKRYEAKYINDIWCCDTTYSFKLTVNGEKKRMFIIGIIDDASRMIVGIDVFFNDNYVNFMSVLKTAVQKYGKPKLLNLDNGAPYKNKQLELLAARLGIYLYHNKPYYGQGKAKIERWFRTMKDHFMANYHLTTQTTIDEFKKDLLEYVNKYNHTIHSSLNNISPITRFFDSGEEIVTVDQKKINESFLLEIQRKVSTDCVIQIDNIEYEVPQKYSNKKITLRYNADYSKCYVVEDHQLISIELLDKVLNSQMKRKQPLFNIGENQ